MLIQPHPLPSNRAKESSLKWNAVGRNWKYSDICKLINGDAETSRKALVKHLKDNHFIVEGLHVNEEPTTPATAPPAPPAPPATAEMCSESDETEMIESDQGEMTSTAAGVNNTSIFESTEPANLVRKQMQRRGLYKRFDKDEKLIAGFANYLSVKLKVVNYFQEVDNVARMLRFIQPDGDEVDIDFLMKHTQTTDFVDQLYATGMQPTTVINYLKNMTRFLRFIETSIDVQMLSMENFQDHYMFESKLRLYKLLISDLQRPVFKDIAKKLCRRRQEMVENGMPTVHDLLEVMRKSEGHIQKLLKQMNEGVRIPDHEMSTFRRYCQAILELKHLQRPSVVVGFTAEEFEKGLKAGIEGGVWVFTCSDHKTQSTQLAMFALVPQDMAYFEAYSKFLRPRLVRLNVANKGRFFLNTEGKEVKSSGDLTRLHETFKIVRPATSIFIRRAIESEAHLVIEGNEKEGMAFYLAHSEVTANKHYRFKTRADIIAISRIIRRFTGDTSVPEPEDEDEASIIPEPAVREPVRGESEKRKSYHDLATHFPVTLSAMAPNKKARTEAGFNTDRSLYDKWRNDQSALRESHIAAQFTRRKPTVEMVNKCILQEMWINNLPSASSIVDLWVPVNKTRAEKDANIISMVKSQDWPGVVIIPAGELLGEGVMASTQFVKGDILCDYHGSERSKQEGERKLAATTSGAMGYIYFFRCADGKSRCIDATEECSCHQHMKTPGRKINHSKSRKNVKPVACRMMLDENTAEETNVILFQAIRDINAHEELFFDYGVNRKSHQGEGADLEWLDE